MQKTFFAAVVATVANASYSQSEALISRQLSADTYCSDYLTHRYEGTATGFIASKVLYDKTTDTNGFVGYLPSNNSIYVVFRGSISIVNWISDFDATAAAY